jgi:hypothetical protein
MACFAAQRCTLLQSCGALVPRMRVLAFSHALLHYRLV